MMDRVDELLIEYGLTRENAKRFVALSTAYNREEIATTMDVSVDTVFRYKRAFRKMESVERARVIAELSRELQDELGQ